MDDLATALKQELEENKKMREKTKAALKVWADSDDTDLYDKNGKRKQGHFLDKAEKKLEVNENHRFLRREFGHVSYHRIFELPNYVDVNGIKANYENGILKITISKKAAEKPKLISVA